MSVVLGYPAFIKKINRGCVDPTFDLTVAETQNSINYSNLMTAVDPTDAYVACCFEINLAGLKVYSWNGTDTLALLDTAGNPTRTSSISWHPSGAFIASSSESNGAKDIIVYAWDGSNLTEAETLDLGTGQYVLDWHPNGNYLAVQNGVANKQITIYSWNGVDTLAEVETATIGDGYAIKWSHDGNYLAVGAIAAHTVSVYSWNGTDTLAFIDNYAFTSGYVPRNMAWSSDDAYIFCPTTLATHMHSVLAFDGANLTLSDNETQAGATYAYGCAAFTKCGKEYVIYANTFASAGAGNVVLTQYELIAGALSVKDTMTYNIKSFRGASYTSDGTFCASMTSSASGSSDLVVMTSIY